VGQVINLRPIANRPAGFLAGLFPGGVWLLEPYSYGTFVCIKKTFNVDDQLLSAAKLACGAATDTETIRLGLEALVRHAAYQRLRGLLGSEPHAKDVSRRREKSA
jgi:hypothetical protein